MTSGQFVYMTELVASGLKREAQVLEIASKLAMMPEIAGGSITSYAGGQLGQDSIRVGTAVRARGLVPNVHLTCVGQDRKTIDKTCVQLQALEMHNIFAISGDWPKAAMRTAVFDIDSVQLAASHRRAAGAHRDAVLHLVRGVAVQVPARGLLYQYLKLEKKIAAGADMAITQVGWDATKFVELKKYLDERGIKTPVLGNVYVLSRRAAERMNTGNPPGCWASDELVAVLKKESEAPDGGLQARLERAARSVAVLKGHRLRRRLHRRHARREAHHVDHPPRRGARAEVGAALRGAAVRQEGRLLSLQARSAAEADAHVPAHGDGRGRQDPAVRAVVEERQGLSGAARASRARSAGSNAIRRSVTGSSASSTTRRRRSSAARTAATACSVPWSTCARRPVRSRCATGPCGGTFHGACEVIDQECIWVKVMARAEASSTIDQLKVYIPPPDRTADRHGVVGEFLSRSRQPARTPEGNVGDRRRSWPHRPDRRRRAAQDRRAVGRRQGAGRRTPPKPAAKTPQAAKVEQVEEGQWTSRKVSVRAQAFSLRDQDTITDEISPRDRSRRQASCPSPRSPQNAGILPEELEQSGQYRGKVRLSILDRLASRPNAKLVIVTAITPTKAGEGKTTTSVALTMGLGKIGKKVMLCLREPSMGPVFGVKGGGTGGGYSQIGPMEDINLHFNGDFHAVTAAHNLLAAALDASIFNGNPLRIDPSTVIWPRTLDMNDRELRYTVVGLGGKTHGVPRESQFIITAASEVMAVFALVEQPVRSPPPPRPHRRGAHVRRRAGDGGDAEGGRRDDRRHEGRDQAEHRADARGAAGARARRSVRQHRARRELDRRRSHRAQVRRLRRHRGGLCQRPRLPEVLRHRLPRRAGSRRAPRCS